MKQILFTSVSFLLLLVLTGCPWEKPRPPLPCRTGFSCVSPIRTGVVGCCSKKGQWVAENKNPKRLAEAIFFEETFDSERWIQTDIISVTIMPLSNAILGCAWDDNGPPASCTRPKRYILYKACLEGEPKCRTEPLPSNPGLEKIDCEKCSYSNGNCMIVNYAALDPLQKKAILELFNTLIKSPSNYTFTNNIVTAFIPSPLDAHCTDREFNIVDGQFDGYGSECNLTPVLPKSYKLLGTGESYNQLFIKFPSVIKGRITRSPGMGSIEFDYASGKTLWISVELLKSGILKTDVIEKVSASQKDRKLVFKGKDFICATVNNIDIGDIRRDGPRGGNRK